MRARSDEQKEQRRQAILDAAWQLFQEQPYDAVTISTVAQYVGIAKGTVYLYFKTKEELFAHIQAQQVTLWFKDLNTQLEATTGGIEQVATTICASLVERPMLVQLLALLNTVLEQNIDYETALILKTILREHLLKTGALLEKRLGLVSGDGARLLLQIYAVLIGLHQLANPPSAVQAVHQLPEMALFTIDFAAELTTMIQTLLRGGQR